MSFFGMLVRKLRRFSRSHGYACDCCGREVFAYPARRLCEKCERELARNDGLRCFKCGRKTVAEGACLSCKSKAPVFRKGISPLVYRGETASLINRIKNGNRRIAAFFAEEMTAALLREVPELKTQFGGDRYETNGEERGKLLLLAVPLTESAQRKRGYNQSEELAENIAELLEKEGIATEVDFETLLKRRETAQQKDLGFAERSRNVEGAYHVHKRAACKNRTILLIDDVMTTGATGNECARLLLGAGAKQVYFLVAAALPEQK